MSEKFSRGMKTSKQTIKTNRKNLTQLRINFKISISLILIQPFQSDIYWTLVILPSYHQANKTKQNR